MAEYVRMPKEHYEAACNSIRAKTGKTDLITSGVMSAEIDGITGGGGTVDGYATVTFMNGGEVLFSRLVLKGDDCPDPYVQGRIELPTKESTVQYDYTFNGWATADNGTANANVLKNITADKTVYAAYKSTVRSYTVTLYDEDGTLLHTEQVAYGSMPSYVPTKEGAGFAGWTPNTPVTGNTSYTAVWSSVLASGSCGASATYTLMNDGVLTVSGTGVIKSSSDSSKATIVPEEYRTLVKKLVVEEGITQIGDYAFKKMTGLITVILPESVTMIGQQCFNSCSSLSNINLPSGINTIGDRVFVLCTSLTNITIPSGVIWFSTNAFYGCSALTSINIPAATTSIASGVFDSCSALTSATFEDTEGWSVKASYGTATALASADLADPATAAQYLRSTHTYKTWTKS